MARAGATGESITAALRRDGADISVATVSRRVREIFTRPRSVTSGVSGGHGMGNASALALGLPLAAAVSPSPLAARPGEQAIRTTRRDDALAEIDRDEEAATTDEELAAVKLRRLRFEDAEIDRWLSEGAELFDAIASSRFGLALEVLRAPADLADLAALVTDDPVCFGRDDGESETAYRTYLEMTRAKRWARATALLNGALNLVKQRAAEDLTTLSSQRRGALERAKRKQRKRGTKEEAP